MKFVCIQILFFTMMSTIISIYLKLSIPNNGQTLGKKEIKKICKELGFKTSKNYNMMVSKMMKTKYKKTLRKTAWW
jgi:hypothetical protein